MLTKVLAVVAMCGAVWVAHDCLHQEFGCHSRSGQCRVISATPECCSNTSDCCSLSRTSCCMLPSSQADTGAVYMVYSKSTESVHIVELVEGKYRCVDTGELLDECCCTPLEW